MRISKGKVMNVESIETPDRKTRDPVTLINLPDLPDLSDLSVRLLENHGTKGPLLPDLPVRLLENHGTRGPLLPDLPVELLCLVAQLLPLRSIVCLSSVCQRFYGIFRSLVIKRLAKMPWSVTVDFSRDRRHHIHLHKVWIKLGWFPHGYLCSPPTPQLVLDLHEFCDVCMITEDRKYVAIRMGVGFRNGIWPFCLPDRHRDDYDPDSILASILRYGRHPRVKISKGYYPHIYGLTDNTSDSSSFISSEMETIFLLGRDYPLRSGEESIKVGYQRIPRYMYDNYCLCESYFEL